MKFDFVYLGQTVLKYQVPLEVFNYLQKLYQVQKKNLPKANKQLVGKIKDEVSLFYGGQDSEKMHRHNFISQDILKWFYSTRLETRTKESTSIASVRVANLYAE